MKPSESLLMLPLTLLLLSLLFLVQKILDLLLRPVPILNSTPKSKKRPTAVKGSMSLAFLGLSAAGILTPFPPVSRNAPRLTDIPTAPDQLRLHLSLVLYRLMPTPFLSQAITYLFLSQSPDHLLLSLQWCSCPRAWIQLVSEPTPKGLSDLPACKLVVESFNSLPAFVHIPEPINLSPFPELICGCPVPAPASGLATIPSVSVPESPNALVVPEPVSTLADIKPVPAPALQLAVVLPYAVPKVVNAPSGHAPGILGALPAPESSGAPSALLLAGFSCRCQPPAWNPEGFSLIRRPSEGFSFKLWPPGCPLDGFSFTSFQLSFSDPNHLQDTLLSLLLAISL
ncbi:hypothetical protein Q8A73_018175 [Channa argus]|nr:hypothetical protein Q8A73_018175 [Channa argus]